ncbi:MAG: peptidylprolyl isomerase [Acidimicrobiales bacterium]
MRRLLVIAALAALAGATSACQVGPTAATVGGSSISRSTLDDQLSQISNSVYAQCALQLQGVNLPTPLSGVGDATVNANFASFELSTLVLEQLIVGDLARRHQAVTSADLASARTDLAAQLTPSAASASPCPGAVSGRRLLGLLPPAFVGEQVRFLAAQERLAAVLGHVDISTPALQRYYQSHPTEFDEVCLSDIAVQSQSQAQSVHDAIASGSTTFGAAAQQSSIDTQTAANGGVIPCVPSSQIVNSVILGAINGLSPGQISQPVFEPQTGGGAGGVWFVLALDGRPQVPFDQAQSQIRQQLLSAQNTVVSAEFSRITHRADVVIDPRYGSWNPQQGVRPPAPPRSTWLLSPAADQSGGSALGLGQPTG